MQIEELLKLQTQRGAKLATSGDTVTQSYDNVKRDCRRRIEDQASRYKDLDPIKKKEEIKSIIYDFVMDTKPLVLGYMDGENNPDNIKLVDALVSDITDYGILTAAMNNEDVNEIRANGRELKVETKGKVQDLLDKEGNVVRFESVEQEEVILQKMLGDKRLTPKDAIVNARTIEGYRIAAVHNSAMSPDPDEPGAPPYHAFVLRKFKKNKMELGDIVKFGTMSDNMARLLALCPAAGLTFVTVGPTASGKTTTNNAILLSTPPDTRTVLIQNPSEIDLRFKDPSGRVYNDVLHMEAVEKENPAPGDPTAANLMDHTLRLSPTFVCFGEVRSNKEFKQAMKIMQAGHPINTTYHAESAAGAIQRFLTAYLAESGNEPSHLALSGLTGLLNIIIVQKIMRDHTRKVIQITEVLGVDPQDSNKPLLNDLYIYDINKDPTYDSAGNLVAINGVHRRVGKLSESTIEKFKLEGVAPSRFDFLTKPLPGEAGGLVEVETYTGVDIESYGKH